jgi:hypothetical protein
MTRSVIEARKSLPSLHDLDQAAGLLNMPGLDDADGNASAAPHLQQAALLARIADWAALAAQAAREFGDLGYDRVTCQYAYLIETIDEHDSNWWEVGDGGSAGVEESHDSPETYALAVMDRYLEHLRSHEDDYAEIISHGELHVRISVWDVGAVTSSWSAPRPGSCPPAMYPRLLKASRISPEAVEIRTPLQVHRYVRSAAARRQPAGSAAGRPHRT